MKFTHVHECLSFSKRRGSPFYCLIRTELHHAYWVSDSLLSRHLWAEIFSSTYWPTVYQSNSENSTEHSASLCHANSLSCIIITVNLGCFQRNFDKSAFVKKLLCLSSDSSVCCIGEGKAVTFGRIFCDFKPWDSTPHHWCFFLSHPALIFCSLQ